MEKRDMDMEGPGPVRAAGGRHLRQKAGKKRARRWPLWVCLGLAAFLVLGAWGIFEAFYSRLNISHEDGPARPLTQDTEVESLPEEMGWGDGEVINILLIGEDNSGAGEEGGVGNSDAMIIVSINRETGQVVLSSLMRDIYLPIPGKYTEKLNLVYHNEGTRTLIDTIEANFGIPIDNYILLDFMAVVDLVDALGGIELTVTQEELYWMQWKLESLEELAGVEIGTNAIDPSQAGELTLNGLQAAAYMRTRFVPDREVERTRRNRDALMAIRDKVLNLNATEILALANRMLPQVTTDLSRMEVLGLMAKLPTALSYQVVSLGIPVEGSWEYIDDNFSHAQIDMAVNRQALYDAIYLGLGS